MIKTAAQLVIPENEDQDHRASHLRKKRGLPIPCSNSYRGCGGSSGGSRGGRGFCTRCYDRLRKYGDSWHHAPRLDMCSKKNCFMRGTPGHP